MITPATTDTHGPFRRVVGIERIHGTVAERVPGQICGNGLPKLRWVEDLSGVHDYDIEQLECGHFGRRPSLYQLAKRRRCHQCGQNLKGERDATC